MIAIIDYNVGNIFNLKNALDFQGLENRIVREPSGLQDASHIILPGVGAYHPAMAHLRQTGMEAPVRERVAAGVPFLGVCIGMQLLFDESEEDGLHQGLGLIPGRVVRFRSATLKVPQIGWNQVRWKRPDPLLEGIADNSYFYFVHSYYALAADSDHVLGQANYGEDFPAVVRRGNIWGAQFHPEKSQNAGLRMLRNFAAITPA
ncbi:MAG: imidazole glycerol phosphate synthase subunit HisH [Deltaproteobacteria bacterium]|nr:imidazole glycerol phosphate synthase subunit HisH [Deltaproteobacteria bacterium]